MPSNWGYAEAYRGVYICTWKVMFSLFCCVVVLVGYCVWWVTTLCGVKRFGRGEKWASQGRFYQLLGDPKLFGKEKRKTTELEVGT